MLNVVLEASIDTKAQHLCLFFFSCWTAEQFWANAEENSVSLWGGGTQVSKALMSGTHMFSGSSEHRDLIFSAALPLKLSNICSFSHLQG